MSVGRREFLKGALALIGAAAAPAALVEAVSRPSLNLIPEAAALPLGRPDIVQPLLGLPQVFVNGELVGVVETASMVRRSVSFAFDRPTRYLDPPEAVELQVELIEPVAVTPDDQVEIRLMMDTGVNLRWTDPPWPSPRGTREAPFGTMEMFA